MESGDFKKKKMNWETNFKADMQNMRMLENSLLFDGQLIRISYNGKKNNLPFFLCLKFTDHNFVITKGAGRKLRILKINNMVEYIPSWTTRVFQNEIERRRREALSSNKQAVRTSRRKSSLGKSYWHEPSDYLFDIDIMTIEECLDSNISMDVKDFIIFNFDLLSEN